MTPTSHRPALAVLGALALLVALGGGCHLIFPFEATTAEPDAAQTSDAMIDAAPADLALADKALADMAPDLPADDLPADQLAPQDQKNDAPPCACTAADLDSSGTVDALDLNLFGTCFGKPPTGACKVADTDSDGDVDGTDLKCINAWFKQTCS